MSKQRTITLTDRAPVVIEEEQWPVVASAKGDSWSGQDYSRYRQAKHQGELDEYSLRVRRHSDGRALVYAVLEGAGAWTGTESRRGGELLAAAADIPSAIRRVGDDVGIPDGVIRDCVADLPPERI